MSKELLFILAFAGFILVAFTINKIEKIANKIKLPLLLKGCTVIISIVPNDVKNIEEFVSGKYAFRKLNEEGFVKSLSMRENFELYRNVILYPSKEYDEYQNIILSFGERVSSIRFGIDNYVFQSIDEVLLENEKNKEIFNIIKQNLEQGKKILVSSNYKH